MLKDKLAAQLWPQRAGRELPPPGLLHYVREHDGRALRYHLRVERDGSGLLVANASEACLLSPSGVLIARLLLEKSSPEHVEAEVVRSFRGVSRAAAKVDVARVRGVMDEMVRPGSRFPLRSLDDASHVQGRALGGPLVADVELTDVATGRALLGKLWDAAVPQSVLLVPEGGIVEVAVALVAKAEDLGMVIGVRGRATELGADAALEALAGAGLDRGDLFFAHADAAVHDGLLGERDHAKARAAFATLLRLEVCPVAVTPLVAPTWNAFAGTARALRDLGVTTVIAFAVTREGAEGADVAMPPGAVAQAMAHAEESADALGLTLLAAAPVVLGPGDKARDAVRGGPRAAGDAAVRVLRDGSVLAASGPATPGGNVLRDPWERIWASPAFDALREGKDAR